MAKEIKQYDDPLLFAGTPPLEVLKYLLPKLSCHEPYVMGHVSVSRPYFHATARRTLYVIIAQEDQETRDHARCGKLKQAMYGTRDAGQC